MQRTDYTDTRLANWSLNLFALLFVGGAGIRDFTLVLVLGVMIGTYSSIFVASPALLAIQKKLGDGSSDRDRKRRGVRATP